MAQGVLGVLCLAFAVVSGDDTFAKLPAWFPRPYNRVPLDSRKTPQAEDFNGLTASPGPACCRPGESCWPTADEVSAFSDALDPKAKRNMHWGGFDNPFPAPLTLNGSRPQPVCGLKNIKPLYERTAAVNASGSCVKPCESDFCAAAARNDPAENWNPAFVVWPVNAAQVQIAVKFARKHNLCVGVVGTGHDFLNRHSTNNGLLIRTTLLKDQDWSLDGAVKLGSGLTFSEIGLEGSKHNAFIATGWASTVGVAGWTIGGGHGPLDNSNGLGVDNLLAVEIVTADGNLITANATHNSDLLWALRGGGGSTWGVMTSLTIKKHVTPPGGFTAFLVAFTGNMSEGKPQLSALVDQVFDWALGHSEKWGGLQMWQPAGNHWSMATWYWYTGGKTDPEFVEQTAKLLNGPVKADFHFELNVANWWRGNRPDREIFDPIESWIEPHKTGHGCSLPSAIISREAVAGADFREQLASFYEKCPTCSAVEIYDDLPHPKIVKQFPANSTSLSNGFRNGMLHLISPSFANITYQSDAAYFSESAYSHSGDSWKQRYWGSNVAALEAIKAKYDPENLFWCKECVGSDKPRTSTYQRKPDPAIVV